MDLPFFRRLILPLALFFAAVLRLPASEPAALPDASSPSDSVALAAGRDAVSVGIGVALNPAHIVIPSLDTAPSLRDLLGRSPAGPARNMLRISNFVQRFPNDGQGASQPTTAYLGYTHEALYVAFVCADADPQLIRAHMLARDSLADDDNVGVFLDTFHDQRRAFVFQSNALGVQADSLYSEQNGFDSSFDTVWDTWGQRTDSGYAVLMRIPFASLYFAKTDPGEMRTWGIILQRNISHQSEEDFWPRSKHDIAGRLTQDMKVEGFRDVENGQNLQFQPYVLARSLRNLNSVDPLDPYFEDKHLQGYGGLDAKFILHNSLVLDTTVNPDFSQVGIDNPAIPNQRFPPFFAEVRPFFIENSSYFMTPINLYYTNNIIKPQFGARLTGKLGEWALGLLGVDDRGPGQMVPPSDPTYNSRAHVYVGRLNRDIGSNSNVGLIYADREYLDSFNRAGGIDYRLRLKNRWTITGQGLTSDTKNLSNNTSGEQPCLTYELSCSGQAWVQELSYSDLHWNWWAAYTDTSAGFVTDTGFFQRPDVRQPNGRVAYTFRPSHGPLLDHGPAVYAERIWDHTGNPLDFYVIPRYNLDFRGNTSISANVEIGQDRLRPIDYSALPDDVEYHSQTAGIDFYTAPVPYLAVSGGFWKGDTINYSPPEGSGPVPVHLDSPNLNVEVKPLGALDLQNSYVYSHFTAPDTGALVYDNHELISRWNYQLTKAASFNLIGQYISTLPHSDLTDAPNSKTVFGDALFTYMPHPGTAIYFGYIGNFANLDRALCTREGGGMCAPDAPILAPTNSSLMNDGKTIYMKISYLLRF
jgi:Domain of unknown function (DUF5916)